jgi:predicted nucleic acid-binding protein
VKFWDTSALAALVVDEPATPAMRRLVKQDPDVLVWMFTSVELLSVLGRLGRATSELADLLPGARVEAMDLFRAWAVVAHVEGVRRRAERLVGVHPLSAADALQLGAALLASGDRPETLPIVTLDQVLARAARLEGFRVIPDSRSTSSS